MKPSLKNLVLFILFFALLIFATRSWANHKNELREAENKIKFDQARFITKEKFAINGRYDTITIVKDRETGILYLWDNASASRGGLTPWLDKDGKPMKDSEE